MSCIESLIQETQIDNLRQLHDTYSYWLPSLDLEVLDVVLACACDRKIQGDPVWLYLVGASAGLKTELLKALEGWETVFLDRLTQTTLVSCYESRSLLNTSAASTIA